jgi:uncharacterized Zn finger protein
MVEMKTADDLSKAAERARHSKLFVQVIQWRQYRVTNRESGAEYTVNFFVRDGKRFGHCTCKAGMVNVICKHLAAAAGRHVMMAAQHRRSGIPMAA